MIVTMLMLINMSRDIALMQSPELDSRAQIRAEQLCKDKQWSHDGWTDSFKGLEWGYIGENLAKDYPNDLSAHLALMESPTHKANIVNPYFKKVGLGKSKKCNLIVELFSN